MLLAQQIKQNKYPSLLWEISGNGLSKPSYLFGTMHVSSKLAFNFNDSLYKAISRVDAVALELNPQIWQQQMLRLNTQKENYAAFVQAGGNEYMHELDFRINDFRANLKAALQTEPSIVNSLLYRSFKSSEDFEEDTFLDLYIYQTARKMGKIASGLENYYETEKLILEAYTDMANEKKVNRNDPDALNNEDYVEQVQNAYRRGDLDLLDSLDLHSGQSAAFREKFIYTRNEIQARAIDSIIKKVALFAGIGAAHLPGNRGVIALLRQKGYILRPVKMSARMGILKNDIDRIRVPVVFKKITSEEGDYSVEVPGNMYVSKTDNLQLDRRQYADMNNGAFYMVTRIKSYAGFLGISDQALLRKTDSLLYENIPGKMLSRNLIHINGFPGYDISNRTRRGDLQRYRIIIASAYMYVFKTSGKGDYVRGPEADRFLNSIQFMEGNSAQVHFQPAQGGFSMDLPQMPSEYFNSASTNGRWEYEATEKNTGIAYIIFKKSMYNFSFTEVDSFDLSLMETSFRNSYLFTKQVYRKYSSFHGYPMLEIKEKLVNGRTVIARFIIKGPHYFVWAKSFNDNATSKADLLNSFQLETYRYGSVVNYTDTFLKASVKTAVFPELDEVMRALNEKQKEAVRQNKNYSTYSDFVQLPNYALFKSDSTGEVVSVEQRQLHKYFYIPDSVKFWQNEIEKQIKKDMLLVKGIPKAVSGNGFTGIRFTLTDTASSRTLEQLLLINYDHMYRITTVADTVEGLGKFAETFFDSFHPLINTDNRNRYKNRVDLFFDDLLGTDSLKRKEAQSCIGNIHYGVAGIPKLIKSIESLSVNEFDYYNVKSKLISELGIKADSSSEILVKALRNIYDKSADTIMFRNEVVKALARMKTQAAYMQLKKMMMEDPPIFDNHYAYKMLFRNFRDTPALSRILFPELLRLAVLDDFKDHIIELLSSISEVEFLDSVTRGVYYPWVYLDAIVALKKQKYRDEQLLKTQRNLNAEEAPLLLKKTNSGINSLNDYCLLLMPFYDSDKKVQDYFSALLLSKDIKVRLSTLIILLKYNKVTNNNMLEYFAGEKNYSSTLYDALKKYSKLSLFPLKYSNQELQARSRLLKTNEYISMDSVSFLTRLPVQVCGISGWVFFYKYRLKATDTWKIGYSGIQPQDSAKIGTDISIAELTGSRLKEEVPVDNQLDNLLKKIVFRFYKSGKRFYLDSPDSDNYRVIGEYGD